jgi:cellulose biosynthesis protein BcsQ/predicted transcriptional regulator
VNSLGQILTFYSYKGGVGRSMGLANVAALLAKWRMKVLVIDWDLEAPGIEVYFKKADASLPEQRKTKPGVIDLVKAVETSQKLDWHDCLLSVRPFPDGEELKIISAGMNDKDYMSRVQHTNWDSLFDSKELGIYIETLRDAWKKDFDFILVDSRTGITDIGGVCTIHLPDFLVVWFTTNDTNVQGVKNVADRARLAQDSLPFDRNRLLVLPVPSRDESRTEVKKANDWKKRFAERFSEFYKEWLPSAVEPLDVVEKLRIPYIPYWSFEEGLPVVDEDTSDPSSISAAYEFLSRLIFFNLEWRDVETNPEQSVEYLSRAVDVDPELADTLFGQALDFWKEERKDESSEVTRRAIETWEKLAKTDLQLYGLKLARAKKFLSELLEEPDEQGSISQAKEAIDIYRNLYKINQNKFEEDVATGLIELAHQLHDKEPEVALEILLEAVSIQRRLAQSDPRRFESDLARELYDLSNWFIEEEQFSEGLSAVEEAVPIYRHLVLTNKEQKEQLEPELADSLITLSECLLETGNIQSALANGREAVEMYKQLAQKNPERYESRLAKSFDALLDILSQVDISSEPGALASVNEAVEHFMMVAQKDARQYEPNLAKSLNMLPEPLSKTGKLDEALATQKEAIEIFRRLKETNPAQYESELALSLVELSKFLIEKQDTAKAQATAQEAVDILKRLAKDRPARYKENLEEALKLASSIDEKR